MSYQKLCDHNRHLYGLLEGLTNQINFCIAHDIEVDLEALKHQKDAVKETININLEKIEEIWSIQALKANNKPNDVYTPTQTEKRVIGLYLQSERNQVSVIANETGENAAAVGRIISRFLNNGYNMAV